MRGLPLKVILLEHPVSCLRQITSGSADGECFLPTSVLVEMDDVLLAPVGVVAVTDDDVGGFNEGLLQVGVALFHHMPIVGLAT